MSDQRDRQIAEALTSLAGSLAPPFDPVELLHRLTTRCARVLGVASAGILLADRDGGLRVAAASSEQPRSLELFQLQQVEGPCLDCFRSGEKVSAADLVAESGRWPRFAPVAVAAGMASVHAIPMRLLDDVLGTVGLFGTSVGTLDDSSLDLGQALAEVTAVVIAAGNAADRRDRVIAQLQSVLEGRMAVEQAKGLLAHEGNLTMEEAFTSLRRYAQGEGRRLTDVARSVVARAVAPSDVIGYRPPPDAHSP